MKAIGVGQQSARWASRKSLATALVDRCLCLLLLAGALVGYAGLAWLIWRMPL